MAKGDILVRMRADVSNYEANIASARRTLDKFKQDNLSAGGVIKQLSGSLVSTAASFVSVSAAIGAVSSAFTYNIATARDFERSMSVLSSLTGKTGEELDTLKEYAIELGSKTTLSASQVADAFRLIGSQQPQLLSSSEALKNVTHEAITLAEAAGIDLATASQTLSTSINQMGGDSNNAARFVNVLAAAAQNGAGDIAWLGGAITKSGVAAKAVNVEYEELVANLETLAKAGYDASTAGTALRSIIMNLEKQSNAEYKPSVVGLTSAFQNLAKAQLTLTEYQGIAGKMFAAQAKALADNAAEAESLTQKITGTNTATEQASVNVNNLDGALKSLSSAWEGLNLHMNSSNGILRLMVDNLTSVISAVDTLVFSTESLTSKFGKAIYLLSKTSSNPVISMLAQVAGNSLVGFGNSGLANSPALAGGALSMIVPTPASVLQGEEAEWDDKTNAGIKAHIKALKKQLDTLQRDTSEYLSVQLEIENLKSLLKSKSNKEKKIKTADHGIIMHGPAMEGLGIRPYASMAELKELLRVQQQALSKAANISDEMHARSRISDIKWQMSDEGRQAAKLGMEREDVKMLAEEMAKALGNIRGVNIQRSDSSVKGGMELGEFKNGFTSIVSSVGSLVSSVESLGIEVPSELKSVVAGLQVITTILTVIESFQKVGTILGFIPHHTGGVVRAASGYRVPGNYGYDAVPAILTSGETVLTRAQAGNIASQLAERENTMAVMQPYTDGEKIYLGMNNTLKRMGRGEIVTTEMLRRLHIM